MKTEPREAPSEELLRRIWGEFSEMPGLRLTRSQARRLWGLDEETCTRILDQLVEAKFLCRTGLHVYRRLTEGAVAFPAARIAEGDLDRAGSAAKATDGGKYGDGW